MSPKWSVLATAFLLLGCQKQEPREQKPDLGSFCVQPAKWNAFLGIMRDFGAERGLELHGGVETHSDGKPLFNAYLARGHSFWRGDDLDLLVTSDRDKERRMTLSGSSKTPWTMSDSSLADELLAKATFLRCVPPDGNGWWLPWKS